MDASHPDLNDLDDNSSTNDPKVIMNISLVDWNNDGVPDEDPGDYNGHGTHVAGIAAGTGYNSSYRYVGIAPGAWIMNIKVARSDGSSQRDDVINGIDCALDNGADIINLSIGYPGDGELSITSMEADDAVEAGVVVVVAAGNNGHLGSGTVEAPGNAFNVITVGAVNDMNTPNITDDELAYYPNGYTYKGTPYPPWGSAKGPTGDGRPKPDVVAPGVHIWSTKSSTAPANNFEDVTQNGYGEKSGTSMAAPHVAGTVALMLHANPNLKPAQVKAILRQTASLNANLTGYGINDRGYGIIDAYAAVQLAQNVNNIDLTKMYDSWNVSTGMYWNDRMNFTVDPPNPTFGVSLSDIHYYSTGDYRLINRLSAQHVWIDGTYYHLGNDMQKYLFSGPRIYDKVLGGWVKMRAWYQVSNVRIEYYWYITKDLVNFQLRYNASSNRKTLMYIDPNVWDNTNCAQFFDSEEGTVLIERKFTNWAEYFRIRDLEHNDYVLFTQNPGDNPVTWVLREGYYGNNPEEAKNDQYTYNRDIVLYYQSQGTGLFGTNPTVILERKNDTLPPPDPTQNDANTGGDAGNALNNATYINQGSYTGILCDSDPTDNNDYYQFNVQSGRNIYVRLTPPTDINFNLELYDPHGNLKNASCNGPGVIDSILYAADSTGNWTARIYKVNGEGQYHFDTRTIKFNCTMKTQTNGSFYVPNATYVGQSYYIRIENLFGNSSFEGDQFGGTNPYNTSSNEWPDGNVNMVDLGNIQRLFGKKEGDAGWVYMVDIYADRKCDMMDTGICARNFGNRGYVYSNDTTGVKVRFDTDQEYPLDSLRFASIPSGALTFNVTRNNNPIGAALTFWNQQPS